MTATQTGMPFSDLMGVEIVERDKARVVGRLSVREDLCTAGGILHGGAFMAFADALGAIGGFLNLPAGARTALLVCDLQNDFIHPRGAYGRAGQSAPAIAALPARLRPLVEAMRAKGGWIASTHFTLRSFRFLPSPSPSFTERRLSPRRPPTSCATRFAWPSRNGWPPSRAASFERVGDQHVHLCFLESIPPLKPSSKETGINSN